ncbi:MAG: hypothetical protein ACD_86C00004G0006 [uncultured bacterium]|nr:MAG: hypothetical protein ACD_86C00004G0006 [uncultured bacterium]
MLTTILALLSSSGVGSLIGWVGGFLNRKVDLQAKTEEYKYNLAIRDKDLEQTKAEIAGQVAVADKQIEVAAYGAMAESYKEQSNLVGNLKGKWAWVDALSKLIRPIVTIIFLIVSLSLSVYIVIKAYNSGIEFDKEDWKELLEYVIHWVFFQSGVVIGWWFANRPSGRS